MSMSIPYEQQGRRNQKARTRAALVDAARDLVEQGATPSVEDAATAASVSRATAFRYFPNQRSLLIAAHPEVEVASLLGSDPPQDPEGRLDAVMEGAMEILFDSEAAYRTMLKLSLEPDPADRGDLALRRGLRLVWIEDALEPVRDRLSDDAFRRLVHALATIFWIEAVVVLEDLVGLTREEVVDVVRWSARSLLRVALAEGEHQRRAAAPRPDDRIP
jgi:AcrR family transcriptional regulator